MPEPTPHPPPAVRSTIESFTTIDPTGAPATPAVLAGASADLEVMFREHYARLVRALTLVCGDREAAADAVQEAFVKGHLRWRRLQHYEDPVGWIRRVAINGVRDGHRRSGRKAVAIERMRGDAVLAEASSVDGTHEAMSRRNGDTDGVMALLRTLPRQQRICIALFHVDGLPIAEIASTLGISEGAVKFHLHQGRERLRGHVAGPGGLRRDEGSRP